MFVKDEVKIWLILKFLKDGGWVCVSEHTFCTNKATTEDLERNNQRYQKKNVAVLS